MKRICRSIPLFVLALCITGGALQAQEEKRGTNDSGAPNLAAYRNELLQNREHLNRAESAVAKIEREKRVTEEDSAAIDRELYAYATAIKSAYDRASQQAETAGKTRSKRRKFSSKDRSKTGWVTANSAPASTLYSKR